jgi:hypothetical protein
VSRPGSVDTAGRILSNYQAALHLLEEAGTELDRAVLQRVGADVFTTVRDACAGSPDLEELVAQIVAEPARADVAAERQRIAATHSRLIRRRPAVDEETAGRLTELAATSHSAGALFLLLHGQRSEIAEGGTASTSTNARNSPVVSHSRQQPGSRRSIPDANDGAPFWPE